MNLVTDNEGLKATVDLQAQIIELHKTEPVQLEFDIDNSRKDRLISGLDDIVISLQYEEDITCFEQSRTDVGIGH